MDLLLLCVLGTRACLLAVAQRFQPLNERRQYYKTFASYAGEARLLHQHCTWTGLCYSAVCYTRVVGEPKCFRGIVSMARRNAKICCLTNDFLQNWQSNL